MSSMTPTPDNLTPVLHAVFREVTAALPCEIASRIKPSRRATRHGTRSSVLLSGIWDRYTKSGVVDPRYFKYEHVYDPDHCYSEGSDWYLQFYLNPNRIYQRPDMVVRHLEPALQSLRLHDFEWYRRPNWIGIIHRFNFESGPEQLVNYLVPRYVDLIQAVHPVLVPILDAFSGAVDPDVRAQTIAGRTPARTRNAVLTEGSGELSRSVPLRLRRAILLRYRHCCARCGSTAAGRDGVRLEIDHAKPVCLGGVTREDNLQPLCRPCHQWKGPRTIRFSTPE